MTNRIVYTYEDAMKASLEYFEGDDLAAKVWISKYALKDSNGNLYEKSPEDMHWRIAKEISRIEHKYINSLSESEIFSLLDRFKYIVPQGSPMAGIGNNEQTVSLSNCFVIGTTPPADSYGGILRIDEEQVQLMKRRGGVGHDLSHLRPAKTKVNNSAITSTGVVSFMERYSNSTREVAQDGRRGALMLSISIDQPDSEAFIDAKLETDKVTGANISVRISDSFMEAALAEEDYVLRYPVTSSIEEASITRKVNAGKLWKKIVHNAWKSAEPGILFWDQIIRESPADCYADEGYRTISTNPCVTGDTLVAVADGRNAISIKQLTDEGKDVPVYCQDNNGKIVIRMMRHPRITGYNQPIYKITLDDGNSFRVTGNHKFYLKDGSLKEAINLAYGDSLDILTRHDQRLFSNKVNQYTFILGGTQKGRGKTEHRMVYEFNNNTEIPSGYVIHHKNFNSLDNSPENLVMMTKEEHDKLHGDAIRGENNPYHQMTDDWKFNFASHPGERNGRYSGITHAQMREGALCLVKKLKRRFSRQEWMDYCRDNGIPFSLGEWRQHGMEVHGGIVGFSKWAAIESGIESNVLNVDTRIQRRYLDLLSEGYDCFIEDKFIKFNKHCEICDKEFISNYQETSVCSMDCSAKKGWYNEEGNIKRNESRKNFESKKKEILTEQQIKIYSDLKFDLKRDPFLKEWTNRCNELGIRSDLRRTATNVKGWKGLKEESLLYNHKVVSVELCGNEDVYNGTVDEFHNFYMGGFYNSEKNIYQFIRTRQCGELPLCAYDSCRLLVLNLYSYVINPFNENAFFDFELFKKHTKIATRMMDDIVDLELEKIDSILSKIEKDPEEEDIKKVEKNLWTKIREKAEKGRRLGIGITAEGDMLAALNLRYGSDEAIEHAVKVHKILAVEAYKESVNLAKERGCFSIWNKDKEKNNPFINRIMDEVGIDCINDYLLYGRRNISMLTIAPTGCLDPKSIIRTDRGNITLEEIFKLNGIDIDDLTEISNFWFKCTEEINVYDITGKLQPILGLYWNGYGKGHNFKFEDNSIQKTSLVHKFLVLIEKDKAIWKEAKDLKIGDKIIKINSGS